MAQITVGVEKLFPETDFSFYKLRDRLENFLFVVFNEFVLNFGIDF